MHKPVYPIHGLFINSQNNQEDSYGIPPDRFACGWKRNNCLKATLHGLESENKYHSRVKQWGKCSYCRKNWQLAFTWKAHFLAFGNVGGETQRLPGLGPPHCSSPKGTRSVSGIHRCALQTAYELGMEEI